MIPSKGPRDAGATKRHGVPHGRGGRRAPPHPLAFHHLRIYTRLIPLPAGWENNSTKAAVRANYTLRKNSGVRLHKADRRPTAGGNWEQDGSGKGNAGAGGLEKGLGKGLPGGCWQGSPAHPPTRCHRCCKTPNGLSLCNILPAMPKPVLAALLDAVRSLSCCGHGRSHGCF